MLDLPDCIEVKLECDAPKVVFGVLVAIRFSIAGQYYFGTLVGLTDVTGVARVTREEIEQDFSENRRFFLMDFRVPLSECDPIAVIHVEGGAEFIERRSAQYSVNVFRRERPDLRHEHT